MSDTYIPWWVPAEHPARSMASAGLDLTALAEQKIRALEAEAAQLRDRIRGLEGHLASLIPPPV
jgi:hypothetical protein